MLTPALISEANSFPDAQSLEPPQTDSQAASQLPHNELDRGEALNLLSSVFGNEIESPAGIFDDMNVEKFLSDNVAVVPAGETLDPNAANAGEEPSQSQMAEPTLIESSLPLRTEDSEGNKAPVDLSLEHSEGELQPSNPLVETGIPMELGEGVSLQNEDVTLEFPEASESIAPSTVDQSAAFYPNVQSDTDLVVAPTPRGVETLTQMRTPEAPHTQTIDLNLPSGATLRATEDGGAEAIQNGRTLLMVQPPSALDADGNDVPMSLSVSGDAVELEVSPTDSTAYPILADPIWQFESWNWTWENSSLAAWTAHSPIASYQALPYTYWDANHFKGLDLTSGFPGSAQSTQGAEWNYYVPRYASDLAKYGERPKSFLDSMQLEGAMFLKEGNSSTYPEMIAGLIDAEHGGWVSVGTLTGADKEITGWEGKFWFPNYENTNAQIFDFALATLEPEAQARYRNTFAAQAIVGIGDHNAPIIESLIGPSEWMNNVESSHISYTVTDPGIGVYELTADKPTTWPGYGHPTGYKVGCTGIPANPCPRTIKSSESGRPVLAVEPQALPQGIDWIKVKALDPLGPETGRPDPGYTCCEEPYPHAVEAEVPVKIDHTAPTLALSGSITEQSTLGTTRPQYILKYNAADGSEGLPAYSSVFGTEGTGDGQLKHPADVAVDFKHNVWVADENNNRIEKFNESGTFLAKYGSLGAGNGQLNRPAALEADPKGNIWVADAGNNRIEKFNEKGEYVTKFGTSGTGNGQLSSPEGIAIDSKGNVWVADTHNNRLEEFSETGAFVRAVGSKGSAAGQLSEPTAIDIGPGGNVWVADSANNRVEEFNEKGEFVRQFGAAGSGNGQFNHPAAIEVDTRGNVWVGDQNNGRVEQFSERGEYLAKFGVKGTGTGQFSFGSPFGITTNSGGGALWVADSNDNRIEKWSGPTENQSGIASVTIKVDNKVIEQPKQACGMGNCPMAGEWTLHSGEYAVGEHTVEVIATDRVALATPQKQTITIARDTTAPQLTANSTFFTAPQGWVEQKSYSYSASTKDPNGSGATSLVLKIDGKEVAGTTQSCPNGACEAVLSNSINMATYKGGAHSAELIATDAAGNKTTKTWTLNVDPKGTLTAAEATTTIEAVEATSGEAVVSPEPAIEGETPGMELVGKELTSTGAPAESVMAVEPGSAITVKTPEGPVTFEPTKVGTSATGSVVAGGTAAVSANTSTPVDSAVRPIYDGAMTFAAIRESSAPEEYSWHVDLGPGQELEQLDEKNVEVYYSEGHHAIFAINAMAAHDAVGTAVPTSLSISAADEVTLTVHHREGNLAAGGAPFVYPILAGTGWEGGFRTIEVPLGELEPETSSEAGELEVSAPVPATEAEAEITPQEAQQNDAMTARTSLALWRQNIDHREFRWIQCVKIAGWPDLPPARPGGYCGNPFLREEGPEDVAFNYGFRGDYYSVPGVFVKHRGTSTEHIECAKMLDQAHIDNQGIIRHTYSVNPARECKWYGHTKYGEPTIARNENGNSHHLTPFGEWVWGEGGGGSTAGLALYIWATKTGYVGHHNTTCIDC